VVVFFIFFFYSQALCKLAYLLLLLGRALSRGVIVVLGHGDVAEDVVVGVGVLARPEVPRLVLRVVGVALEALELVVEIHDVESLFLAQGTVLRKLHYLNLTLFLAITSTKFCFSALATSDSTEGSLNFCVMGL